MATTKRSKGGRAAATRAKAGARGRAAKPATAKKAAARSAMSAKATAKTRAKSTAKPKSSAKPKSTMKPKVVAKPRAAAPKRPTPARAAAPKRPAGKPATVATENAEVTALKNKFQRERSGLERRLTEAVREIGLLRHHELRAMQLERQVAERDATIVRLQAQLAELQRRPSEAVYVHEVQQSLALVVTSHDHEAEAADLDREADAADLDELEDERLADDGDLVSDD